MKRAAIATLSLLLALAMPLLTGCGGSADDADATPHDDGRGDVIEEEEEEVTADIRDFYGCWEYAEYDYWIYFYEDGTYEWFDADGTSTMGSCYLEGEEMILEDADLTFILVDDGLLDSDGDHLFASELPEFYTAYFEDEEIPITYTLGQGEASAQSVCYSYTTNPAGGDYKTAPLNYSMTLDSTEDLGDGTTRWTYSYSASFASSMIPPGYTGGFRDGLFDYYSGVLLPTNAHFSTGENQYAYQFESWGETVNLQVAYAYGEQLYADANTHVLTGTITVVAPSWYDGLAFALWPVPGDYASYLNLVNAYDSLTVCEPNSMIDLHSCLTCLMMP